MAYQQTQVPCPPNTWTQICQYRPTRKSLSVQCPQLANLTTNSQAGTTNDGTGRQLLPADPLRVRLVMSKDTFDASTTGFRIYPNTDSNGGFIWLPRDAVAPIMFDTATDEMAAAQWNAAAQGAGTHAEFVQFIVETAVCPGIILATTQNAAVAGGPYGSQPPGIWLSPDFGSGPAIFQLSDDIQDEQVIQQWYCWTVGSATVNVTVSESWAVDQPPPVPEKFVGILPKLSPSAMDALNDLLARTADVPEDETATD